MKSRIIQNAEIILSVWLIIPAAFAQIQTKPGTQLEAKEQVDCDPNTVAEVYERIAANNPVSTSVRAESLLHLAICYEKMGQQAQNVYLQIVQDFSGQPAAQVASARLATLHRPASAVNTPGSGYAPWLGELSPDGSSVDWKQLNLAYSNQGLLTVSWSPDSTQILYSAGQVLHLRNIASGEERELYEGRRSSGRQPPRNWSCIWATHYPNLFCEGTTRQRTTEAFSISVDTGSVQWMGTLPGSLLFSGRDDQAIYLLRETALVRFDIGTWQATTVERIPGLSGLPYPDEHWMARRQNETIEIRPTAGGDWKPLISINPTQMVFTPDGCWLLYHDVDAAGRQSLFRVATAGGKPERLGDFPSVGKEGYLRISPDGGKLIAETNDVP